ncbi:peptide/nickel transport system substrate-binding protein [Rhodococcus sp. LBL1]|nr:peptide/nickel transport system substrate-binding protein [Rhodococcus sp. LBL1]MDH6682132.1 peptide/nickel transport system substrate-binding protein [Rhodococcus sp. LBL2]
MRSMKKFTIGLVAATAAGGLISGCGSGTAGGSKATDDTLSIGAQASPATFDPTKLDCVASVLYCQALYDTLIHVDADGNTVPGLASGFEYDATNTVLTMTLREGVKFSDGAAFDAASAKSALDTFIGNRSGPAAGQAALISAVNVRSPYEIEIVLSEPDPGLLNNLALNLGIMYSPASIGTDSAGRPAAASGPYIYDENTSQTGAARFARNPGYWDKDAYPFDKLELRGIGDPNTIVNGLTTGQLDAGTLASAQVAESTGLSTATSRLGWVGLIIADREGKVEPALGKLEVRQAINLAIDRDTFSDSIFGDHPAKTEQIFTPGSAAHVDALDATYPHDMDRARKLMAEAGYADGFTVTMPDLSVLAGSPALNTALDQQLGAIGIKINWVKVPPTELLGSMMAGKYPMYFMLMSSKSPWADLQASVLPAATYNSSHASDPNLNRLLQAAKSATPGDQQDAVYQDINRWLVENAWFAPVVLRDQTWGLRSGLELEPQVQGVSLARFKPAEN